MGTAEGSSGDTSWLSSLESELTRGVSRGVDAAAVTNGEPGGGANVISGRVAVST